MNRRQFMKAAAGSPALMPGSLMSDASALNSAENPEASSPLNIGSRLELFVDDYLISSITGAAVQRLHHPVPQNAAVVTDKLWEGNMCGYITVFQDGDKYRMYYQAGYSELTPKKYSDVHDLMHAYAESSDGKKWEKPELGLIEFRGSKRNNLVFVGFGPEQYGIHGFSPFKDPNPDVAPDARYKAVGGSQKATQNDFHAMKSPDGFQWSLLQETPIMLHGKHGAFDSQNLAFWDPVRKEYRAYVRDFDKRINKNGRRCIRTGASPDFLRWTDTEWLEYPGAPAEQLYTNGVIPYYRAPHILLGFPTRYIERGWSPAMERLPELVHRRLRSSVSDRYGMAITDGLFMSSRDGKTFHRWQDAFIRPGPQIEGNWTYGDNYQNWGIVVTKSDIIGAPEELSFYVTEGYWRGESTIFRRYTLRIDGFVSMHAPRRGGEFMTKPLIFDGRKLILNFSTSAAGSIRVHVHDRDGIPIEGFSLQAAPEIFGDSLEYEVPWAGNADLSRLSGQPVRLRFALNDADLFSLQFRD